MNLSGLLNACNEMLAQPLPLAWSSQTPRFLVIFTGLYKQPQCCPDNLE